MRLQASEGSRYGWRDSSDTSGGGSSAPPATEPLAVAAFDSHCHLDLLDTPVEQALAQAQAVGIARIVTVGVDLPSSQWCAQRASEYDDVWATVAVHPNEAHAADDHTLGEIARLAAQPQVRAVGETGLDYYRDWADRADQQRSFRAHIDIAKRAGKALVVHNREAHADVLRVLAEEGPPERVVMHCFSGDADMAKACAGAGYFMSFAGNVTFKNASDLREAAAVVPAELLLVETDAPFLTPVPHRGKVNAPQLVPLTVRALADTKGINVDDLCAAVTANGERVFGPW